MYWTSIITNSATDAVYLSGNTLTMIPFSNLSTLSNYRVTIAAKYSLQTKSYIWVKAYSPYWCCGSSIALNKAEDTLAIVIVDSSKFYIYLIDPYTGIEKYKYL